jgi:hypothetical protein
VPAKSASVLLAVAALGFVAAIAALYVPAFSLPACALLGMGLIVCCMSAYFGKTNEKGNGRCAVRLYRKRSLKKNPDMAPLPAQVFTHTDCFSVFVIEFAIQEKAVFS